LRCRGDLRDKTVGGPAQRRLLPAQGDALTGRWRICGTSTFNEAARSWKPQCNCLDLGGRDRLGERQSLLLMRLVWQLAAGYGG
jgi:hypothetical protein